MAIWLAWWSCCLAIFFPLIIFFFFSFSNFRKRRETPSQTESIVNPASPDSSSQPLPSEEYEVFLSFRGPDTRNNIADFLYTYLARSRIRTFRDEEELRKGDEIAPGLIQAIRQSKIYIPIFSRTYASSKWCLKELAQMVDCRNQDHGHVFFPIFYLVDPRDVRHQTGSYQEAFRLHEMKHGKKTVQGWRDALKAVGDLKGWHVTDSNGQGKIVDQVFEEVLSILNKNYTLVTDELVGIDHHVEKVLKLLDEEDSDVVKVVGIHGMGGIGKTTIATVVYNEISTHFTRCSFLEDVRETLEQHDGVVTLQNTLISSITSANSSVTNASEGLRVIKDRVWRHRVLIVLDDVDEKFEAEKILGRYENFSAGSRFIITTRNKKLLTLIKGCELYEAEEMSDGHSLQLFSKHAFRMDRPPKDYERLSRQIVLVSAGLPLTLKVVGSLLFCEDKSIWEATLVQLKEIPPTEVVGRLKLSYNTLTYEEQKIFLDIACFFIGENRQLASYMWKDCKFYPVSGINVLIRRSLIKVGPKNEFKMHDQLRDLGRVIVREENIENPWKRSRVWSHDDALDMLEHKQGTDSVEALRLTKGDSTYQLTNEQFEKLPELRYLDINGAALTGDFDSLLSNLRWLRVSPLKGGGSSPITNFPPLKLVILDLSGSYIPDHWGGWTHIKMAQNLKVLNLYTCGGLTKVPDLSEYKNLEHLNLAKCRRIGDQDLDIGTLENLKVLKLGFTRITRLIGDIGMLRNLEEIDAWGCRNLKELAPDIGESTSLKILRLCSEVKLHLPELPLSLTELSVSSPIPNLSNLKELVELRFDNCEEGFEIPGDYVMLSLSKLKSLELYRTNVTVGQTPGAVLPSSLNKLVIDGCPLLDRLPNMENLESLKELKLSGCPQIKEIQGLGKLTSLVSLTIDDGQSLVNMDGLENLLSLTELFLLRCPVVKNIPTLANLVNVKSMSFWRCDVLTGIRGLNGGSKSLRELDVGECPALQELEGLDSLERLEHLRLRGLDSLEQLPSVSKLTKLKQLLVRDHPRLRSIEGVERLKSLRGLSLEGCSSLERFPDLSTGLKSLTVLCFDGCVNLTEVAGLAEVESLQTLSLKDCVKLTQVLGIEKLKSLADLNLPGCTLLEELPDLSGLKSLRTLNLSGCAKLREVVGVEKLASLTVLNLSGCASLERLPDVSGLKGLKVMNTSGCTKLAHGGGG